MTPAPARLCRPCLATLRIVVVTVAPFAWAAAASEAPGPTVQVERTDGTNVAGVLDAIDRDRVTLVVAGEARSLPVAEVRRIRRDAPSAAGGAAVRVVCTDGSTLSGDDFLWDGVAAVVRGEGRIEMPVERVRLVAWPGVDGGDPAWMAAIPAEPTADVVAVSRGDGFELVECAIEAVAADTVTVVLDGERLPVKRGKVLGLAWVRPAAAPTAGTRVEIDGGSVTAELVEWSPRGLVLDGVIRIPAGLLASVDYAAGRTVSLAALETEKASVEPFFGGLATIEGLSRFFAPRPVPGPGSDSGRSLLVRPRTTVVWRVPPDSRRFRATAVRGAAAKSAAAVRVAVRSDDATAWERTLDAATAEAALEIDVSTARRLAIEVDFVAGGIGCPVRFDEAVFEK